MNMMRLLSTVINWDDLFTHISEFVRLDEHLRIKVLSLEDISPESRGWTFQAGVEITDHKRSINNMRCFLHYHAREIWGDNCVMFTKKEYEKIKMLEDNRYRLYEEMPEFNSVTSNDQFWFLMRAIHDQKSTNELYEFLVELVYKHIDGRFLGGLEKNEITKNVLQKVEFSLP